MTENFQIRTKLSTARIGCSQLSALISGIIPKLFIDFLNKRGVISLEYSYLLMGIGFAFLYALP